MVGEELGHTVIDLSRLRITGSVAGGRAVLCLAWESCLSSRAVLDAAAFMRRRGVAGSVGVVPLIIALRKCS